MDWAAREREGKQAYARRDFAEARVIARELYAHTGDARYALLLADCAIHLHDAPSAVAIVESLIAERGADSNLSILHAYYLRAVGRFDESRRVLDTVHANTPGYSALEGWHLLRDGHFRDGMNAMEKESGIYREESRRAYPTERRLKGGEDVRGLTILLILEGGFGDQVLQARIAEILHARGARVIVECSPRLADIVARMPAVTSAAAHGSVSPIAYDRYLPAQSAWGILGIDSTECALPYLSALPERVDAWRERIDTFAKGRKKIGIHWQGNWEFDWSEMKSPHADEMLRLAECGTLVSLQRDAGTNTLPESARADVFDAESGAPSWEDTMAVIMHMDVVVSNCTSTAHIASALGIPTILLAAHAPHYYWASTTTGDGTDATPWYASMRVARQPRYDDWTGAIDETLRILRNL